MPDRVVIYRLGSLGDTVAALPCFHLIERAFPDAERLVLTNVPVSTKAAPLEAILSEGGFIHGAIPYPVGIRNPLALARLALRLRRLRTDTLVYLAESRGVRTAKRDVAFFRLAGFKRIVGAPVTEDDNRPRIDPEGHRERETARLARRLEELGPIDLTDRAGWNLRLTDAERATGREALGPLADRPFVAVNTGGKAAEKDWGEANWTALLGSLSTALPGRGLVFVGAPDDVERAARLSPAWTAGEVVDLCGKLGPRESAAALAHAELFVGHDSGPLHLADAVDTPAIGLFGDFNEPKVWHPAGPTTQVIHRMEGLATITPEDVVAVAEELLSRRAALGRDAT